MDEDVEGIGTDVVGGWDRVEAWAMDRWPRALAVVATAAFLLSYVRHVAREGLRSIGSDPALFQHVGWYATQGASPYVHAFDIKPPLVFETTTAMAYLAGGNPAVLHAFSVLATAAAFVSGVVLVGKLTHHATRSRRAALAAGAFLVAFAPFHMVPATGMRPKYLALAAGLGAMWLVLHRRGLAAGAAGAASTGFWQFGLVFPILCLTIAARRRSAREAGRIVLGGALASIVILIPVLAWGAFEAMATEAILAPTMTGEGGDILFRGAKAILHLGWTLPLVFVGTWGFGRALVDDPDLRLWLGLGALLIGVQLAFLDYDGPSDLFFGFAFLAIGFGTLVARSSPSRRRVLGGLLAGTLFFSVVAQGGFGLLFHPAWLTGEERREDPALVHRGLQEAKAWVRAGDGSDSEGAPQYPEMDSPYGPGAMSELYWEQIEPDSCHYRLGDVEIWWLQITERPVMAETCGEWPNGAWGISP